MNKEAKIVVVDDCSDILWTLVQRLKIEFSDVTGLESVDQALRFFDGVHQPFLLVTDYEISASTGAILVETLVQQNKHPAGVILMSGRGDIHELARSVAALLNKFNIDFFLLEKPFPVKNLLQLLRDLSVKTLSDNVTDLLVRKMSKILLEARSTLGVSVDQVVARAATLGLEISSQEYARYETEDAAVCSISATQWQTLCKVLYLPVDFSSQGYSRSAHLHLVESAVKSGSYAFTHSDALGGKTSIEKQAFEK